MTWRKRNSAHFMSTEQNHTESGHAIRATHSFCWSCLRSLSAASLGVPFFQDIIRLLLQVKLPLITSLAEIIVLSSSRRSINLHLNSFQSMPSALTSRLPMWDQVGGTSWHTISSVLSYESAGTAHSVFLLCHHPNMALPKPAFPCRMLPNWHSSNCLWRNSLVGARHFWVLSRNANNKIRWRTVAFLAARLESRRGWTATTTLTRRCWRQQTGMKALMKVQRVAAIACSTKTADLFQLPRGLGRGKGELCLFVQPRNPRSDAKSKKVLFACSTSGTEAQKA